jgi:hypothetical protein
MRLGQPVLLRCAGAITVSRLLRYSRNEEPVRWHCDF